MEHLVNIIAALGERSPAGALIALVVLALLVGGALYGVLSKSWRDAGAERRAADAQTKLDEQEGRFQRSLIDQLAAMRSHEAALVDELRDLRKANWDLLQRVGEMDAQVALLREQTRRLIDVLRDVRDGRIAPHQIVLPTDAPAPGAPT